MLFVEPRGLERRRYRVELRDLSGLRRGEGGKSGGWVDSFPGIRIPHRSEFTDLMVNHNRMTFAAGPRPRSAVLNVSFENGLGGETHTYVQCSR